MSKEFDFTEGTGAEHGVVEWRDSFDGDFGTGWLVDCGSAA